MKLLLLGLCCVGFVAAIGTKREIRISGKIECCSRIKIYEVQTFCNPPYKAELELIDQSKLFPNTHLKTLELTKGENEYLLEWTGETIFAVNPLMKTRVYCEKDQKVAFGRNYDWSDSDETNIKQDITMKF